MQADNTLRCIFSASYIFVEVRGYSGGLDGDEIASDPVEDGLEDCYSAELGHSLVEDEAAHAGYAHRHDHRGPTGVKHFCRLFVAGHSVHAGWHCQN